MAMANDMTAYDFLFTLTSKQLVSWSLTSLFSTNMTISDSLNRVTSSPASLVSQTSRHCVRPALIACTHRSFVDPQPAVAHSQSSSGAAAWNDLPAHVTAAPSFAVFRQRLKTFLFSRSYPDIVT